MAPVSQEWVMDPNDADCNITNTETAELLMILKDYFDNCEKEKQNMYKKIVEFLNKHNKV